MEITKQKQKLIDKIAKKYSLRLRLLLLFGSQIFGKTHQHSDFDVAFLSARKLSLRQECQMDIDLFPVMGSRQVDLVNLNNASPLLYYGIFENSQVLYESEKNLYNELSCYAFKKFVENMPLYEMKKERLKRELSHIKI